MRIERTRRMLNAVLDVTRRERVKRNESLNEVKDRIGHLHEQVMRNAISLAYGPDWGTEVTIRGFTDAVSFVSHGLGKSPLKREEGKIQLTKRFCKGLSSFKFDVPDYQSTVKKKDSEELRAEQKDLEERYYEVETLCPQLTVRRLPMEDYFCG